MTRLVISIFVFAVMITGVRAETFDPPGLSRDALAYAQSLKSDSGPQKQTVMAAVARADALSALANNDAQAAVRGLEKAVGAGDDSYATWMALSGAWMTGELNNPGRALHAAFVAYRQAETADQKVTALVRMGRLLDEQLNRKEHALQAYQAAAATGSIAPEVEARLANLRQELSISVKRVRVQEEHAYGAQACFLMNRNLSQERGIKFKDFVSVDPAVDMLVEVHGDELCVAGLGHGQTYRITLREGLPAEGGLHLAADKTHRVSIGNKSPAVAFRGDDFILPRHSEGAVPVTTVNLDRVDLSIYRINDRSLVHEINTGRFLETLSRYSAEEIANERGTRLWQGTLDVENKPNQEVTTAIPVRRLIETLQPGLYALVAEPMDVPSRYDPYRKATQWLMISDLGLTTFLGGDGLHVFARSLSSAEPLEGLDIVLFARNNEELSRLQTDASGHVHFAKGLTQGTGGRTPLAVMAYGADSDFAVLDLSRPAFDLSDRGVSGRQSPGPLDVFLYTDRGVYRPGETVHLSALLRDDAVQAVEDFPLTLKVLRPSNTEFFAGVVDGAGSGGHFQSLTLTDTAPRGTWTVLAYADPGSDPIGRLSFQVEDFVPERLAVDLEASGPYFRVGEDFSVTVDARFLYGPPAAGLDGSAEISLQRNPVPYPDWRGYQFGLVQDSVTGRLYQLPFPGTDEAGKAVVPVSLPALPDTTKPLRAQIRVAVTEPGGRPTRQQVVVPVRTRPYEIGLQPAFEDRQIEEGGRPRFNVITVAPDGALTARSDLSYELIKEHWDYQWYFEDGRYRYRVTSWDETLESGTVDTSADAPVEVALSNLSYGRYRLEVYDEQTDVASSVRFTSGWWVTPRLADTPDEADVTADKESYAPGDVAKVRIDPPFAGQATLVIASDKVHTVRTLAVPETGATVEIPVTADWGPGTYALATIIRPPGDATDGKRPVRAVGLTWLASDPAPKTLTVALDAPDRVEPRQTVEIPLRVTGAEGSAAGDAVFVTLAAVDEGILQLTDFASPDPAGHFLAKRALGLEMRDDYGRLLTPTDAPEGKLRQGGGAGGAAGLPVVPITIVSLFQGPVAVDEAGEAIVPLEIPAFNGELRLMAVAYGKGRIGHAAQPLTVRDPLVAQITLPRFLAPGDESRMTLSLHAVDAPAGDYGVTVHTKGPVTTDAEKATVSLSAGERKSLFVPVRATGVGIADISVDIEGPEGLQVARNTSIAVRSARQVETVYLASRMEPGETFTVTDDRLGGYMPGTGSLSLTFGTSPPFNVAGLLGALDRFPYGCLEQITSRALPLLVVGDVETAVDPGNPREAVEDVNARIQRAIGQILDKQRYDGAFGMWSGNSYTAEWPSVYAMEFLARAKAEGYSVPDGPFVAGLDWLRRYAISGGSQPEDLAGRAYALRVLAMTGHATPSPVRYFNDAFLYKLPTPLSKGQVAAALAAVGERARAERAADSALGNLRRDYWYRDYGSTVRDIAALISVLSDADLLEGREETLVSRLPASARAVNQTSTQEQAWLVLAAHALIAKGTGAVELTTGAADLALPEGNPVRLSPALAQLADGVAITNAGDGQLWRAVSVSGVPKQEPGAEHEGLRIRRYFYNRDGSALNLDDIRQNDVFVMVLEGEADTGLYHQAMAVHALPAGWEIENSNLGAAGVNDLPWLGELSYPETAEARDDRYVAAIDLTGRNDDFRLAFLVRAVTPGNYELPGAYLFDMYKPAFYSRQGTGRITVHPPRE